VAASGKGFFKKPFQANVTYGLGGTVVHGKLASRKAQGRARAAMRMPVTDGPVAI
jgi:hypothetical protein